ncbi:MAG: NADH-quinone oxidoreductase subunit N [Deltaproteobacteria bacterium]|nr:NADH-quinone oxidoreductase subunit N [Deltaproteobacteria bacterium]
MNELRTLWVPLAVSGVAIVLLLVDVLSPPGASRRWLGWFVAAALAAIFAGTFLIDGSGTARGVFEGGPWTVAFQRLFLAGGVVAALGGVDDVARRTPLRIGEYWLAMLFSLAGMCLLPGARELVFLIVAFELMGVPLYVLAAYAKTDAPPGSDPAKKGLASEAALKMYLTGATSTAITLFGLALFTGMAGTTRLDVIGTAPLTPLGGLGLAFVLAGMGYKLGMVPFHMWVPDTYEGASTPFVAFLSVAPKAAGIAALSGIFLFGMGSHRAAWGPALGLLAVLSMAIGNLLALPQTDLRRLLGYSGIAQMGYLLVSVAANDAYSAGMTLFFLTAYLFTNMGAFLVLHAAAEASGSHGYDSLNGLAQRAPGLAASMMAFLLSLAGIPFVVGFWAKLYIFLAAWRAGLVGLVVAGIVLAVIGLFYYLKVLQAAYMTEPGALKKPEMGTGLRLAIGICVLAVVGLGLWPRPLVDGSLAAAKSLLDRPAAATTVNVVPASVRF